MPRVSKNSSVQGPLQDHIEQMEPIKEVLLPEEDLAQFDDVIERTEDLSRRSFKVFDKDFRKKSKSLFIHTWKAVSLTNTTLSTIRGVAFATAPLWNQSSVVFKAIQGSRLLAALRLPFSFINIGICLNTLFTKKRPYQIDAALTIVSETAVVADSTATFSAGLAAVGAVAPAAVAFTGPLLIVGGILSVAVIIANIRGWVQTAKVIKQLNQELQLPAHKKYDLNSLQTVMQFIDKRSEYTCKQMWKVNKEDLKGSLAHIQKEALLKISSANPEIKAEGEKEVDEAVRALKGRLNKKIYSHAASITACAVSLIGLIVVLTGGMAAPAGFALMALGGGIGLGMFIYNLRTDRKFRKSIGLKSYLQTIPHRAKPVKPTSRAKRLARFLRLT